MSTFTFLLPLPLSLLNSFKLVSIYLIPLRSENFVPEIENRNSLLRNLGRILCRMVPAKAGATGRHKMRGGQVRQAALLVNQSKQEEALFAFAARLIIHPPPTDFPPPTRNDSILVPLNPIILTMALIKSAPPFQFALF